MDYVFAIDMTLAPPLPHITAVSPNLTMITAANVGTNTFTVAIQFDKVMDWGAGCDPTVTLTGDTPELTAEINQTLVYEGGTWTSDDQMHYATFHTINMAGSAKRPAREHRGHGRARLLRQHSSVVPGDRRFSVDTTSHAPPHVVSNTPYPTLLTDADVGTAAFSVTVHYYAAMDTTAAHRPVVTFETDPGTDQAAADATLSYNNTASSWSDDTDFVAKFDVADANVSASTVYIKVQGDSTPPATSKPATKATTSASTRKTRLPRLLSA